MEVIPGRHGAGLVQGSCHNRPEVHDGHVDGDQMAPRAAAGADGRSAGTPEGEIAQLGQEQRAVEVSRASQAHHTPQAGRPQIDGDAGQGEYTHPLLRADGHPGPEEGPYGAQR